MRACVLNENFDFNPKNLLVITEKPTNAHRVQERANQDNDENMTALKKKLEVLTSGPKSKYPYPMTASQEMGWENDELFHKHRPKYGFNRKTYHETQFANHYVTTFHKSPFASNKPEMDIGGKK